MLAPSRYKGCKLDEVGISRQVWSCWSAYAYVVLAGESDPLKKVSEKILLNMQSLVTQIRALKVAT